MLHIALMLLGIGSAPKVDWREPGCRLSVFAEACEERLGVKVVASPEVADQVVVFAVRETAPEELLKRVADAVGGELERDHEGIYRLFRSPRLAEQQRRDHETMVAAEFSRIRDRLVRGAALDREADREFLDAWRADRARFDEVERDARYFLEREHQMRESAYRFGARLLQGVALQDVGPIGAERFRVFRATPTSKQFKLNLAPARELARLRAERAFFLASEPPPERSQASEVAPPRIGPEGPRVLMGREPVPEDIEDVVLLVGRSRFDLWRFIAYGVSRDGLVELWDWNSTAFETAEGFQVPEPPRELRVLNQKFLPVAETREFYRCLMFTQGGGRAQASEALLAKIADPVAHEPYAFLGPSIMQVADAMGVNLVAHISDGAYRNVRLATEPERSFGDLFGVLARLHESKREEGWLTIQPRNHHLARLQSVDRAALKRYAEVVQRDKVPSVRERSLVSSRIENDSTSNPVASVTALLGWVSNDNDPYSIIWSGQSAWRALVGSLSHDQWAVLAAGRPLQLVALQGRAKAALEDVVFGSVPFFDDAALAAADVRAAFDRPMPIHFFGRLAEMPTQSWVAGVPPFGELRLQVTDEPALLSVTDVSTAPIARTRSLEQLAFEAAWAERRRESRPDATYAVGRRQMLKLTVGVGRAQTSYWAQQFAGEAARALPFGELPETLREAYARALERARIEVAAARIADDKPPPPPTYLANSSKALRRARN